MILRLYKTVFWISFAIAAIVSLNMASEIISDTRRPKEHNVLTYRIFTNSAFYSKSLDAPADQEEIIAVKQHMASSLEMFYNHHQSNFMFMILSMGQFLTLISFKKWFVWVIKKE